MGFSAKHIFRHSTSIAAFLFSMSGIAAAPVANTSDFFNVTPEIPAHAVHTNTDLSQIFQTGSGPYSTAMDGKIYPYPMTKDGVPGAPLYNGCYNRKGVRLGNLDANNSCAAIVQANPDIAIFRLFVGYKVDCADAPFVAPTCKDMRLLMNCQYTQVQTGKGSFESHTAPIRECSAEHGIVRKANANSVVTPAQAGCYPGTDGSGANYPSCPACATGTFNPNYNPNFVACTKCGNVMTVDHVDPDFPIDNATDWVSSKNIDGSSPITGSKSQGDCKLKTGRSWKCATGYQKDPYEQGCVTAPPTCSLSLNLAPKNPSPGMSDGGITATASGASGTVLYSMTAPTAQPPTVPGPPAQFNGLNANTYTISATDANCATSASVTLTDTAAPTSCTNCPNGATATMAGTCEMLPTTSPSSVSYAYACQGAGGCTSQPCNNVTCGQGSSFGQRSSFDSTPAQCGDGSLWTSFGGTCSKQSGPTTNPGTTTCPSGFTLSGGLCTMACTNPTPSPVPCNLAITGIGTNPTAPTASDGSIAASTTGASGPVAFSIFPNQGTKSGTGANATYSGLAVGNYTVTASDGVCSKNAGVSLTTATPPGCAVNMSAAVTSPPSDATSANGAFKIDFTGTAGKKVEIRMIRNGTVYSSYYPYTTTGNPATVTISGASAGYYEWTANAVDPTCTVSGTNTLMVSPATCGISLSLSTTAARDASGGSIVATASGVTGTVTMSISPNTGTKTALSPTSTRFSGLSSGSGSQSYTITVTDSACTKTASASMYSETICQNLCGGNGVYYGDVGDFSQNVAGHQATRFDGTSVSTCTWLKTDGTTFGSPYVTCGGSGGHGPACQTTQGAVGGEKTWYLSSFCISNPTYTGCRCSATPW